MNEIINLLKGKSLFITGASGLIGSALIDLLMRYNEQKGWEIKIYAASRNEEYAHKRFEVYWNSPLFTFVRHDVTKFLSIDIPIDFIVHGASNASPKRFVADPVGTIKANLWGTGNLLELAKEKHVRLLYLSSGEVYGEGDGTDFTETYSGYVDCLNPRACYPSSKRAAETLCIAYKEQYGVDVVIARPGHIYGSDTGRDDRAFAQFLRKAMAGEDIVLKSDGRQVRSYCHVEDCASALLYILLKGKNGEAYNVTNRESVLSIKELAEKIARMAGVKVEFDVVSGQGLKGCSTVQRAVLDARKLECLGWKASVPLFEGLSRVLKVHSER